MAGLDPASLRGWAGPSQPSLVTGPCQWPALAAHARVIFYACMNSTKVIKLPSYCSSSILQREWKNKNRVLQSTISCIGSLTFSFCFSYILTHIISVAGTEKGNAHTWLWRGEDSGGAVSSASLCRLSFSLPFAPVFFQFLMLFIPLFSLPYATLSLCFLFFLSRRCHLSVFLCCLVLPSSLFFFCLSLPVLYVSLFSFLFSQFSFSPPSLPFFHRLSLAFISQRMACGATSNLVTACRGIVAVKHSP